MNKKLVFLFSCFALLGSLSTLHGATTQDVTVNFQVDNLDALTVSGSPGTLTISSIGFVSDTSTTYGVTTNSTAKKISGAISLGGAMPTGLTLNIDMAPPTGAVNSAIDVTLVDQDIVTGIDTLDESGLTITYKLTATALAQPTTDSRTITYTLYGGS